MLRDKTTGQARRIVLNLNDYPVGERSELIEFILSPTHKDLKHLDELLVIVGRQVTREYWRFSLYIGSNLPKEKLGNLLYNMICEVLFVQLIDYEAEVRDQSDTQYVSIGCPYFSMSINLDDEVDYTERYRKANLESYGVDTNVFISIQFITRTFDIGWLKLLEKIGKLLQLNNLDLVVEDHTTYPLLKRVKGHLIINSNLDYRTWYMTKENLALLNHPYEEDFL